MDLCLQVEEEEWRERRRRLRWTLQVGHAKGLKGPWRSVWYGSVAVNIAACGSACLTALCWVL